MNGQDLLRTLGGGGRELNVLPFFTHIVAAVKGRKEGKMGRRESSRRLTNPTTA